VAAIEAGFVQEAIEAAAYEFQREIESAKRVIIGVNRFRTEQDPPIPTQQIDPEVERQRARQLRTWRQQRHQVATEAALAELHRAATGNANLFEPVLAAFRVGATLGEVCGVLKREWGEYRS